MTFVFNPATEINDTYCTMNGVVILSSLLNLLTTCFPKKYLDKAVLVFFTIRYPHAHARARICTHMHTHTVLSPSQFSIIDTSGADYHPYQHGGIARQVKVHKTLHFVSCKWNTCMLVGFEDFGLQILSYMSMSSATSRGASAISRLFAGGLC